MNDTHDKSDESWAPCPDGTLAQSAQTLRMQLAHELQSRRRMIVTGVVAAGAILMGVGIAGWQYLETSQRTPVPVTAISCERAGELMPRFVAGKLSPEGVAQLREHIGDCPGCAERYMSMVVAVPADEMDHDSDMRNHRP